MRGWRAGVRELCELFFLQFKAFADEFTEAD